MTTMQIPYEPSNTDPGIPIQAEAGQIATGEWSNSQHLYTKVVP